MPPEPLESVDIQSLKVSRVQAGTAERAWSRDKVPNCVKRRLEEAQIPGLVRASILASSSDDSAHRSRVLISAPTEGRRGSDACETSFASDTLASRSAIDKNNLTGSHPI